VAPPSDSNLTIRKADLGSLFVFCEQSSSTLIVPFKVTTFASLCENRPEVEIGWERRIVVGGFSQFNRPSPVSYLCSVNTARPALAVSSNTRNPTGSGNRRQMATPSGSNLTIRKVDLNLLLSKHSSSNTCHLQVNSTFTSR
jgi:hypothetical protein